MGDVNDPFYLVKEEIQGSAYVSGKKKAKAMVVDEPDDALTSADA